MVAGYPIEYHSDLHSTSRFEPLYHVDPPTPFTSVADDGNGKAVFTVNDTSNMDVGFGCHGSGGPYTPFTGFITAVDDDLKTVTTTIDFISDTTGTFQELLNIQYLNTPKNILREIIIEIRSPVSLTWQITLDGVNWVLINNGEPLEGLSTFALFITQDEQINIRYETVTGTLINLISTVASAE